jgi:hypothetical protein
MLISPPIYIYIFFAHILGMIYTGLLHLRNLQTSKEMICEG